MVTRSDLWPMASKLGWRRALTAVGVILVLETRVASRWRMTGSQAAKEAECGSSD